MTIIELSIVTTPLAGALSGFMAGTDSGFLALFVVTAIGFVSSVVVGAASILCAFVSFKISDLAHERGLNIIESVSAFIALATFPVMPFIAFRVSGSLAAAFCRSWFA